MLGFFEAIGAWLRAIPGPTEHWATILAAWAWPISALLIAYMLRKPIAAAAKKLADRIGDDDIEIPGFVKLTKNEPLATLRKGAVTEEPGTPEEEDANIVESLLEYAGDSKGNSKRLVDWIEYEAGPDVDPETFLIEKRFAEKRKDAYIHFVKGGAS